VYIQILQNSFGQVRKSWLQTEKYPTAIDEHKGRRNFALARNRRNFIFPTSICGQFPVNRFAGLSGILFTHTRARTEYPWWRASAWGERVWVKSHERKRSLTKNGKSSWIQKGWQNTRS